MSIENPLAELQKKRLLPERHPQGDIFLCDIGDAAFKGDQASMEHPIFSLSTKPDLETKRYENGDTILEVQPGVCGRATIYDRDILIFAISQLMAAKNEGREISRKIVFSAYDLLVFTNRVTNGGGYEGLRAALNRLESTRLRTTITTGGNETWEAFGLVDKVHTQRKTFDGRVTEWGLTISDWLFRAIEANEVLTLDPGYFRLRKSIDRRVYDIARKHCGLKPHFKIGLELLLKKTGSRDTLRKFRMNIRELARSNVLPNYGVELLENDMVLFTNRDDIKPKYVPPAPTLSLKDNTIETARLVLEGWDVQVVRIEWLTWVKDKGIEVGNPDAMFISFCQKWRETRGRP